MKNKLQRTIKNKSIHNYAADIEDDFNIEVDSDRPFEDYPYDNDLQVAIKSRQPKIGE